MFENKNKLKYINLKNLLNNHLINDDPNKKDIYSIKNNIIENSKNKIQILNNNLKFDKRNIIKIFFSLIPYFKSKFMKKI